MTITYYAHLQQKCEGCDYTIGCGHALRRLKATTLEAARVEAVAHDDAPNEESYTFESRIESLDMLKSIRILAVVEEHDLSGEIAAKLTKLREGRDAAKKEAKRLQIEKLQRELAEDK